MAKEMPSARCSGVSVRQALLSVRTVPARGRSHARTRANPIGIAADALQSKLPGELKGKLPAAKQLADIVRAEMEGGK